MSIVESANMAKTTELLPSQIVLLVAQGIQTRPQARVALLLKLLVYAMLDTVELTIP